MHRHEETVARPGWAGLNRGRRRAVGLLVVLLLGGLIVQEAVEAHRDSPTYDEPAYVDSGYFLLAGHPIHLDHPPLAKTVFGVAGRALAPGRPAQEGAARQVWMVGPALSAARGVTIAVSVLLALLVLVWSLEAGVVAAVAALAVAVCDPTLLAHGHLATLDLPTAATLGLSCYLAEHLDAHPGTGRFCLLALALGAAFLTKWTTFVLIPALPMAAGLGSLLKHRRVRAAITAAARQLLAGVAGLAVMVAVYALFWHLGDLRGGILAQLNHEKAGHASLLLGRVSLNPAAYYFLFALIVKSPLPFLPMVIVGIAAARRRTFLWVPALALLVASSASSVKLGIRYLLPGNVLLYVLAGIGVQYLWSHRSRWWRVGAAGLLAGYVVSSVSAFPDHLSYFNQTALVSSWQGQDWLNDSNADWGQGLHTLRGDLVRLHIGDVCLDYFGPTYVTPDLPQRYLPGIRVEPPGPCAYQAVSSDLLLTQARYAALRHQHPLNGGPIYVFRASAGGPPGPGP